MKLLAVYVPVHHVPVAGNVLSGGERHFVEVYKRCRSEECKLTVVTTPLGSEILRKYELNVDRLYLIHPYYERFLIKSNVGIAVLSLLNMVQSIALIFNLSIDFDMVICPSHFLYEILPATVASRNKKTKLVVYLHHLYPLPFKRLKYHPIIPSTLGWISQFFGLALIRRYAHLVFNLPYASKHLSIIGLSEEKSVAMSNGVDMRSINKIERSEDGYDACFLGRLSPLKGTSDLIIVWKNVCKDFPDARIALIGTEREKYLIKLKADIISNNLQRNIIMVGSVPEEKKYAILKASKVFVFPSYEEGFGIAILEAMACGLPVVAYDLPAYRVFGLNTLVKVPVGDTTSLLAATLNLLANTALRAKIGKRCKQMARQFDWAKITENELRALNIDFAESGVPAK